MQAVGLLIFARTLGPAEYAVIVAATAVAAVAAEFVGFGAGDLLVREVSRLPANHRSAFGRALRLVAISLIPVTLVAAVVADRWFRTGASFLVMFSLVGSEVVATRLVFLTEQIAIAHHETHAANANRMFATFVRVGVICFAVFAARITTASQWAIYAIGWAIISAVGCLIMSVRKFGSPDFNARFNPDLHLGAMFSLMQILRAAQFAVDKFAVGLLADASIIGSFGLASRVSQFAVLPSSAVTRITYPMFFARGAEGLEAAVAFARKIAMPVLAIGIVSSASLIGAAYILPAFLGPSFGAVQPFLLIMFLLPVAASIQNLGGSILSGADFQAQRVFAMAVGLVLIVGAMFAGAELGGITGTVAGYMVGQFLAAAAMFVPIPSLRNRAKLAAE
jgi:O-antigen/teichoic acid export membrane protein